MRSLLVSLFLVACATSAVFAQEGVLKGKITDATTHEGLIGASVIANPGMTNSGEIKGVITDLDGNYLLPLTPGIYFMDFTFIGYLKEKGRVVINAGDTVTMNIEMRSEATDLGIVTVSGSKYEKNFGEESVSMEVLPPSFIANNNITTLDKAVDKIPGVNMVGETMNIRGGAGYSANAGSRVLALVDDIPWLTPQNSGIAFWAAPLETVKQVEIIKGASSTLYGSSAINGSMNIITENAKDKPFTKFIVYTGVYENPLKGDLAKYYWSDGRPRLMYGAAVVDRRKIKKFDYTLDGAYNRDESYLLGDHKHRGRFHFKTRIRPNDNLTVGINGNLAYQQGDFFFIWAGYDSTKVKRDSTLYVPKEIEPLKELPFNIDPYLTYFDKKGNKHSIKSRYYYIRTRNSGDENTDGGVLYGEYTFHSKMKSLGLDFVTGVAGSQTYIDSEIFMKRTSANGAVFLQIDKKFFKKLTLTAGFRGELFKLDTLDIKLKPIGRGGINYQFAKASYLRASFGLGYRYPSIAEKFVQTFRQGVYVVPNANLDPESSWNAELGFKQGFKISKWYGYLDVAGFVTRYYNLMEFTFAPDSVKEIYFPDAGPFPPAYWSDNVRNARISGFEFSALGTGTIFGVTTNFLIGYTFISPIDLDYDPTDQIKYYGIESDVLIFRFKHTAKCDIQCEYKGFTVGISTFINSFMENIDFRTAIFGNVGQYRGQHEEPTYALDTRVGYEFSEKTKVTFIAKNVTNNAYSVRPGLMEAPRNYTLQLSYEF